MKVRKTLPNPAEATRIQLTDVSLSPQGRAKDLKLNGKSPVECTLVHVTLHFTTKPERVTLQIRSVTLQILSVTLQL